MAGADELNMGSDGVVLEKKESAHTKMKESKEEFVSKAHITANNDEDNALLMRTVHANETNTLPTVRQSQQRGPHRYCTKDKSMFKDHPIDHNLAIS